MPVAQHYQGDVGSISRHALQPRPCRTVALDSTIVAQESVYTEGERERASLKDQAQDTEEF